MKNSFKRLIVGAAFLCVGVVQAAVVNADGFTLYKGATVQAGSTWSFSRDLTAALEIPAPTREIGVYGGAWKEYVVYPTLDEFGQPAEYGRHFIHSTVSELTIDDVSAELKAAAPEGGVTLVLSRMTSADIEGGRVEIGELDARVQVDGGVNIYGVISGQALGAASGVNYAGLLFTVQASDVEGLISFAGPPGFAAQTTLHNLSLSDAGLDALAQSLGLSQSGLMYTALRYVQPDFGDLTVRVLSLAPIPEPSAYALMGGGLLCLVMMLGRRRSS